MSEPIRPSFPATIEAFLRGTEFSGDGTVELVGEALGLTIGRRRALVSFARIDGLRHRTGVLELFADSGDVIALHAPSGLDRLAQAITASAVRLPELTRSLRGLGSHRALPNADHDEFFKPFLVARARAERMTDPLARLDAFSGDALRDAVSRLIHDFAASRYPARAADRRATEALLEDCTDEITRRLGALDAAARAVRDSATESQLARWRDWRDAVHDVIDAADRCWFAMRPVLTEPVATRKRWWRRGAP